MYLQLDTYLIYIWWYLQLDPYFFIFADMCTPVELLDLGCIVPSVCQKVLKVTPGRRKTIIFVFTLIWKSKTPTQQSTYIFRYCIHPRRMILFQIRFSSISLFLLVSFSIPSHVLAVHLAVEHWKDGIKYVTCKKLNKVHLELSVKAPPVGGLVWSFVVTFDVWLLREFLLDCGLHSGQSDNFRQSPTHFFLFLVNMILSNHIHLPIQMRRVPTNWRRCFYPFTKICCRSQCLPLCLGCN